MPQRQPTTPPEGADRDESPTTRPGSVGVGSGRYRKPIFVAAAAFAVTLVVVVAVLEVGGGNDGVTQPAASAEAARTTQSQIAKLEAAARRSPDNPRTFVLLASALLQFVRETGDVSAYDRADRAIAQALKLDPSSAAAYGERGVLRLARHDFRGALSDGRRARDLAPGLVQPLGVVVDANVELGRYEEAERVLQKMVDLKPNLNSYARVAYYRELRGDLDGASVALALAASAGGAAPENVAFVQALMGNIELAQGRFPQAKRAFDAALAKLDGYPAAEAGLAGLDVAQGRLKAAIERMQRVVERLPTTGYVTTLGELQLADGQQEEGRRTLELVGAAQQLLGAAGVNTDAEIAVYEADHGDPKRAVKLGRSAWSNGPSVRSADALGWALTKAGKPREGLSYGRRALRLGSRDASYLFHAGMSAKEAGRPKEAERLLRGALAANPGFSPLHARTARRALEDL